MSVSRIKRTGVHGRRGRPEPLFLTETEVRLAQGLDRAASARREAARRQDAARFLCIDCHGPDGEHVSECRKGEHKDA